MVLINISLSYFGICSGQNDVTKIIGVFLDAEAMNGLTRISQMLLSNRISTQLS